MAGYYGRRSRLLDVHVEGSLHAEAVNVNYMCFLADFVMGAAGCWICILKVPVC